MGSRLLRLYDKHKESVRYLFFGILTTLVNFVTFFFLNRGLGEAGLTWSIRVAWFVSVLFAYVTNRRWVFDSKAVGAGAIAREAVRFFSARIFSGLLDELFVRLTVQHFGLDPNLMKLLSNVIVILLNYLLSKFLIFRSSDSQKSSPENKVS